MSDIVERLRAGTAGLTLFEIEALWGEAATALSAVVERRKTTGDRFFIDHGQIHDRATGKHVTTDEDSVFCDGINSALELLNGLDASVRTAADRLSELSAELDALRGKLAGVDAKAHAQAREAMRPYITGTVGCYDEDLGTAARAAIAAYLAALGQKQ